MKKFFTLIIVSVLLVSTAFAQKKCVYIVKVDATKDQPIINYLNANGYAVTVSVADGSVPTGTYDLAVISETNGSRDAVWAAFRNAPMPFIALSTFASRTHNNSLSWITTGDYSNTDDVSVNKVATSHPILAGITGNRYLTGSVVDGGGYTVALAWVNYDPLPSGATVVTTVTKGSTGTTTLEGPLPQIIAFEKNTTLNVATLANRAVTAGFNSNANVYLTADGLKVIKQACDWVVAGTATAIPSVVADNLLMKIGNELVNPTHLEVVVYNILGTPILNSKEASINVSGLTKGAYIAKTKAGVMKFVL